jgi:hypothetical protein
MSDCAALSPSQRRPRATRRSIDATGRICQPAHRTPSPNAELIAPPPTESVRFIKATKPIASGPRTDTDAHYPSFNSPRPRNPVQVQWHYIPRQAANRKGLPFCRSIEGNRNFPISHFDLAAALTQLGREDEARFAVKGLSRARPYIFDLQRSRRPETFGPDRAHSRRHAHCGAAPAMTATRP